MVGIRRVFIWAMILMGIASSSLLVATSSTLSHAADNTSITDPTVEWDAQADSFIYYRYLYRCYSGHDVGKTSGSDIDAGKWFQRTLNNDFRSNLGYLAPSDGSTSCGDSGVVTTANTSVGFDSNKDAFCSIQPVAKSNGGSDKAGCLEGSNDFDMEDGRDGQTRDFEKAAQAANPSSKNIYSNGNVPGYILYIVMKKSLEKMCGEGAALSSESTSTSDGGNAASVAYVNPMSGQTSTVIYKYGGDKEDGSNIPDIYAMYDGKRDGGECGDFATGSKNSLNQYADSFSKAVVSNLNSQVASYLKAGFKTTEALNEAVCGKTPGPNADPREKAGYGQCVAGITAKYNSQVDVCVSKLGPMPVKQRVDSAKQCLKDALPEYKAAIDAIADPKVEERAEESATGDQPTCAIDGLGWIICPAMTFLASLNDAAYGLLSNFLEVRSALVTDEATMSAWERFRDIANIAFIISFLVIMYSQLTGVGITNYGVKKLLPRIFIAAILVNISYWLCAIAVDLSNIVGGSVYDLFNSLGSGLKGGDSGGLDTQIGGMWTTVMAYVLGGAAIALLLVVVITAPTALLALGLVVLILIARQALVILLLILAPLAFVAYLLPNTEAWFTRWRKAFIATLMVYPVVGVIFGASELAATILMNISGDNGNIAGGNDDENMLKIIALGVLAVPLFTVPAVLKGSLAAIGSVSGKLSGLQDRANGFSRKKLAGSRLGEAKGAFDARRQERRVERRMDPKAKRFGIPVGRMNTSLDNSKIGKYIGGDRGAAAATSAYHKIAGEEMERQGATLTSTAVNELLEIAKDKNQSAERRGAALKRIAEVGGHQHVQAAYDYLMTEGAKTGDDRDHAIKDVQQFAAESLLRRKPAGVGATTANAMKTGTMAGQVNQQTGEINGVMEEFAQRIEAGKFDANALASMDVDDHIRIAQLAESGRIGQPTLDLIRSQMQEIQDSDTMSLTPEQQRVLNGALSRQAPTRTNSQGVVEPLLVGLAAPTGTPSNNPATVPPSQPTSSQSGTTTAPFQGPTSNGNPSP